MKRNVAAIVLAAGSSSRMGQPKQLLPAGSRTLLRRSVEAALGSQVRNTFVVLGAETKRMRAELRDLPATLIENPRWIEGIGTSVSAAVALIANQRPEFDGVIFMTCDQPHVSAAILDRLLAEHDALSKPIVASCYAGTRGVPAFFSRAYFDALRQLPADRGAKELLLRHPDDVAVVEFEPGAIDLDTPTDYERFVATETITS